MNVATNHKASVEDICRANSMVVCNEQTHNEYYTESPCILVEVLSSTRRIDKTIKRMTYQTIPALQEYILIEQDFVDIEVCRRNEGWLPKHYFLGDQFRLESIGLTLSVEQIYHRVDNADVLTYMQEQQTNANCQP